MPGGGARAVLVPNRCQVKQPQPHPEGDRKGPIPSSTLPSPLQRNGTANFLFVVFVRSGAVWSWVGTLAVALGMGLGIAALAWLSLSSNQLQGCPRGVDVVWGRSRHPGVLYVTFWECRGQSPLPAFGVSPKNSFSFFAAGGGESKRMESG